MAARKYDTYKEACYALGLLSDENGFIDLITYASKMSWPSIAQFVCSSVGYKYIDKCLRCWNAAWSLSSDGILYKMRRNLHMSGSKYFINTSKLLHSNSTCVIPQRHFFSQIINGM